MKTKILKILLISIVSMLAMYAHAAYLKDVPITITQPDGTVIHCFATGDEYYNWAHDADGYTIIQDSRTGYYCYAILNGDELIASQYVVGIITPQSVNLTPNVNISGAKILERRNAIIQNTSQNTARQNSGTQTRGGAIAGKINNIVVYIRFHDQSEFPADQSFYNNLFNDTTIGANSMRNYFREVSYGQLDIESHFIQSNNGTTIFSYQDSHNRGYYCVHSATNPLGYNENDWYEWNARKRELLSNAIDSVAHLIPPSLNIDYDNDGYVDNICFIVRGGAETNGPPLWPHKGSIRGQTINGKATGDYNLQIEEDLKDDRHGNATLCHEMNHTFNYVYGSMLGTPDLYYSPGSVGIWDLMASTTNPPRHMGAYMKYRYNGWISTIPEITSSGTYTLQPLTSATNNCYKIPVAGSTQYFVMEYRKKTGAFESSLPGSGMIIYRIEDTLMYYGNNAIGVEEVYVFRPDISIYEGDSLIFEMTDIFNAYFSDAVGRTTFGNSTNPRCVFSDGSLGNIYIKNIRENSNGTLSFDIRLCDGNNKTYTNNSNLPVITKVSNTIQTSGAVIVKNTDNVIFEAGNEIRLGPGFEIQAGGTFEIDMHGCGE